MKKLIINLSGKPLENIDLDFSKINNWILISSFKGERTLKRVSKWIPLPYSYNFSSSANFAFWITNYFIDKKIYNFNEIECVTIFTPFSKKPKEYKIKRLRKSLIDHYFNDTFLRFHDDDSFKLWDSSNENILNVLENLRENYKNIEYKIWHKFKKRVKRIYCDKWDYEVVNGGNEGIILREDENHLIKKISKSKKDIEKDLENNSKKYKFPKPTWALEDIDKFYNFKIKYKTFENIVEFKYHNILMPTANINYAFQAHSLIKQRKLKILIDDNKVENYAKYQIQGTERLFKTIFNDFGAAFIKYDNDKDYDQMFFSITRDNYYFVKNFRHHNLRQKVRDRRRFNNPEMIKDKKFHVFYDFVSSNYKIKSPRRACEKEELPKDGTWLFCCSHQNTMTRIWEKNSNKYLDLTNLFKDEVIKCNCSDLLNGIKKEDMIKYYELDLNLNSSFTSYKVNFGPKIIAVLTTEGKRDISKSLESIELQSEKVDDIFIASEVPLTKYKYEVLVNPYEKGLARNTMQALSKIKFKYPYDDVYICTLDDDDLWKKEYIKLVREKIKEGYNFIGCDLEVFQNGNIIDVWKYKKSDININKFLLGNPGLQGSNKVFNLQIALESGGMPKHINSSTDRAFNINLLSHPKINFGKINSPQVIFNKDNNRKRISNNSNRLNDLKEFYKHFWHLLEKDLIEIINKRHKEKHGFNKVISWK